MVSVAQGVWSVVTNHWGDTTGYVFRWDISNQKREDNSNEADLLLTWSWECVQHFRVSKTTFLYVVYPLLSWNPWGRQAQGEDKLKIREVRWVPQSHRWGKIPCGVDPGLTLQGHPKAPKSSHTKASPCLSTSLSLHLPFFCSSSSITGVAKFSCGSKGIGHPYRSRTHTRCLHVS